MGGALEVGGGNPLAENHNEGGESWLNDAVLPLWTRTNAARLLRWADGRPTNEAGRTNGTSKKPPRRDAKAAKRSAATASTWPKSAAGAGWPPTTAAAPWVSPGVKRRAKRKAATGRKTNTAARWATNKLRMPPGKARRSVVSAAWRRASRLPGRCHRTALATRATRKEPCRPGTAWNPQRATALGASLCSSKPMPACQRTPVNNDAAPHRPAERLPNAGKPAGRVIFLPVNPSAPRPRGS